MDLGQQGEGPYNQEKWGIPEGRGHSDVQQAVGETVKKLASIDAFYLTTWASDSNSFLIYPKATDFITAPIYDNNHFVG